LTKRHARRTPTELAVVGLVVFVCATLLGTEGWREFHARETQLGETRVAAENMARSLAHQAEQSFDAVELVLSGLVDRLENDASSPDLATRVHDIMAMRVAQRPEIRQIVVLDAAGKWRFASTPTLRTDIDNSDRPYQLFFRAHPEADFFIGRPARLRTDGAWSINVSHAIRDRDGRFAGVVTASIDPGYYQRLYENFDIGEHGSITLVRYGFGDDKIIVVRRPFDEASIGRSVSNGAYAVKPDAASAGSFSNVSSTDGRVRTTSYRSLERFPLLISVALSEADALAEWRGDALLHLIVIGALVLLALLLGGLLVRRVRIGEEAKQALRESETLYRLLAENSRDMIVRLSLDGAQLFVSPGARDLLGYQPEELQGAADGELVHCDDQAAHAAVFRHVASGGGPAVSTYRARAKDGRYVWVEAAMHLVKDAAAGGAEVMSVVRDVSQRKEAEAHLLDAIESIDDGFVLWDPQWRLIMCNSRFREMYSMNSACAGMHVLEFIEGGAHNGQYGGVDDPKAYAATVFARMQRPETYEHRLGDGRWLLGSNRKTSFGGWVGIRIDITEQKQREQELDDVRSRLEQQSSDLVGLAEDLAAAKAAAEAASETKSAFLASMSHEIRTPMNGILGMNNLLLDTELSPEQRSQAEAVRDSADGLLTVLNDILDISKLEAGRIEIESIDFDLEKIVDGVIDLLSPQAYEKGLAIGALVAEPARGSFRGDPTRLRQILTNLVGNAMKFTDRGSVMIEIARLAEDGPVGEAMLRFEIIDTGIGISAAAREHLFEKFRQADSSVTRRFGGTGLGLAISKQFVELMGGTIEVDSEEGQGSTFRFTIPLAPALAVADEILPGCLPGRRALIVDDMAIYRRIFRSQIEGFGLHAADAADAEAALHELQRSADAGAPYDIVLIDHRIPGTSAATLAQWIRSIAPLAAAKLILLAASPMRREQDIAIRDRFDAVLVKPAHRRTLLRCLTGVLDPDAPQPEVEHRREVRATDGAGKRILLAEDNLINQRIAITYLHKAGYAVDTALDGAEAVAAVCKSDYDLVLMDVQMPRCDGVQATQRIRALPADKARVPIIAMTAHAMAGARAEYIAAGMNDYLSKPIDPRAFLAMVERWTQRREPGPAKPVAIPVVATPQTPALDESRLANLAEILPETEFDALITMWLDSTAERLALVAALAEAGDLAGLRAVAHDLVSTAGNFGACRLEAAAERMGGACKSDDLGAVKTVAAQIAGDGEAAIAAVTDRFLRSAVLERVR
jgi:PAS domain S-box-containing protein